MSKITNQVSIQLPILGKLSKQDEAVKFNASRACAKCRGLCCLAFTLGLSPDRFASMAESRKADVERMEKEGIIPAEEIARQKTLLYDEEFARDNFVPIPQSEMTKFVGGYTYSCKAFDVVNRRCTKYNERPTLCKRFICGPASIGEVPEVQGMVANPEIIPALAEKFASQKWP